MLLGLAAIGTFGIVAEKTLQRINAKLERVSAQHGGLAGQQAVAIASKPVLCNSNVLTEANQRQTQKAFRVRQYVDAYKEHGQHDAPYDADAVGLLNNWLASNYGGTIDTNLPSLAELSDKLATNPACDDPLVLAVAAVNTVELHEAIRRLERAVNGFEHSPYKAYPRLYATVNLAEKLERMKSKEDSSRIPVLDASAKRLLKEAFQDGSILPEDQAEMAEILIWNEDVGSSTATKRWLFRL